VWKSNHEIEREKCGLHPNIMLKGTAGERRGGANREKGAEAMWFYVFALDYEPDWYKV
jgi:hypothetical protein